MLVVCSRCHRHLRRTERACPFCGQSRSSVSRLPAGGALALMVGLSATIGCGGQSDNHSDDTGGTGAVAQGGLAAQAGTAGQVTSGGTQSAGFGGGVVAYGPPPFGGAEAQGGVGGSVNPAAGGNQAEVGGMGVLLYGPPPFGGSAGVSQGGEAGEGEGGADAQGGGIVALYGPPPIGGSNQ